MIANLGLVKQQHDRKKRMTFYPLEEKLRVFMQMERDFGLPIKQLGDGFDL